MGCYQLPYDSEERTSDYSLKVIHSKASNDYFPYGKILRKYVPGGGDERYLTTGHERDHETISKNTGGTGLDNRGARLYYSDGSRFISIDPAAAEYPSWSPYAYVLGNPIMYTDPDGKRADKITVGDDGMVTDIERNDDPNTFFTESGEQLFLNDGDGLDSPALDRRFEVGEKVFEYISRQESQGVIDKAGSIANPTPFVNHEELIFAFKNYIASRSNYDFGFNYLQNRLGANSSQMTNLYRGSGYEANVPFVRFEGTNTLYNLPDAGNFMYAKRQADNGISKSLLLRAAQLNEGWEDGPADQRALSNGHDY